MECCLSLPYVFNIDHFGSLIHHMVLEITLGSHFRLRSHFSENSVKKMGIGFLDTLIYSRR